MVTWRELVAEAAARLERDGVPEPEVSARWIGQEATGSDGSDWHEVIDAQATKRQLASFDRMVERRSTGEPLQYVLGRWGFRTLDLMVDHRVLIPRPETETVAGRALAEFDRIRAADHRDGIGPAVGSPIGDAVPGQVIVDLGTGSGAIGLALAAERPGSEIWLTDVSADALAVARANLAGLGWAGGKVRLAQGSWFEALDAGLRGSLAVVVANPPYVASADDLDAQVAWWEPEGALLAGDEGREHLLVLVDEAPGWLRPDGALVLEMSPEQVPVVVDRAAATFVEVEAVDDLAGRPRAVVARHPRRS